MLIAFRNIMFCTFGLMFLFGLASMRSEPVQYDPRSRSARSETSSMQKEFATELRRYQELGRKQYPTKSEIREFLILDGRLGVKTGQWTAAEFEEYTSEKY